MDKILAAEPLTVPTMLVGGLRDQEDIYGAIAVYKAVEPKDKINDKLFLVLGPWYHGQQIKDGNALGAIKFNSDTALYFRQQVLRPFLEQYLEGWYSEGGCGSGHGLTTGGNRWSGCARGRQDATRAATYVRNRCI